MIYFASRWCIITSYYILLQEQMNYKFHLIIYYWIETFRLFSVIIKHQDTIRMYVSALISFPLIVKWAQLGYLRINVCWSEMAGRLIACTSQCHAFHTNNSRNRKWAIKQWTSENCNGALSNFQHNTTSKCTWY